MAATFQAAVAQRPVAPRLKSIMCGESHVPEPAGRLLERRSNASPRGMIV